MVHARGGGAEEGTRPAAAAGFHARPHVIRSPGAFFIAAVSPVTVFGGVDIKHEK